MNLWTLTSPFLWITFRPLLRSNGRCANSGNKVRVNIKIEMQRQPTLLTTDIEISQLFGL